MIPPRGEGRESERPRRLTLNAQSPHLDYPPIDEGGYLIEWLADAGWCQWTDGGATELAWREIQSWDQLTGSEISAWEARALRMMSAAYAQSANAAREQSCLPPWPEVEELAPGEIARRRKAMRNTMRDALTASAKSPPSRGPRRRANLRR